MGKGDKKTRRGKLFSGSFGVLRRKKSGKEASTKIPNDIKHKDTKEIEEVKDIKEVRPLKETAPVKTPKAAVAAKKEVKPKKPKSAEQA